MDFNSTIDLIIKDLDEAREIIDDLKKYPGVPALQVELAKSKCKSAGEIIAFLKNYKDIVPLVVHTPVATTPPVVIAPPVEITPPADKKTHPVEIIPTPVEKKEDPMEIPKEVSVTPIIADKFYSPSSLNEQLGGNVDDDDIKVFLKTKPITSLSEVIGVNDKFLFIREIFDGNKAAYNQAISRLDNVKNIADAREIILSYTNDKIEIEAVKQLINLVKRKLPSDE
jgi:hypothetical protein